jgi:hypothetical protein
LSTRESQTTKYNHLGGQLSYAYYIQGKKTNWKFGLSFQTSNYQFGNTNFIWADQVNSELTAFTNPTQEPVQNQSIYSLQAGAGILTFGKNWFAGFAAHNINEPNIAFYANMEQPLHRKFVIHGGIKFKKDFSSTFFIPTIQITKQHLTTTYAFDAIFQNGNVFYGLGNFTSTLKNKYIHSLHTFFTIRKNAWAIGYDLDFNLNINTSNPALTHEFNLIYLLKSKSNKRAVSQLIPIL